ncbi:BatD family protein [Rhizobium sp. GCM10022189]|uniref:BatD family protein n=1 Tax=Rhizobium sp. GCM10022189 TaxID=3252654 RepID=UPI00361B4686
MRILLVLLSTMIGFPALAADPFVRSEIETSDTIVPGQQLRLTVDIFAPGFFTSPPDLPLFDIPDALVTLPEERAQNLVQTVDGVEYSGIRRQYAIVPQKAGTFTVPSIAVEFTYSSGASPIKASVSTATTSFVVSAVQDSHAVFSAHDLEITQSFDPDPKALKAGDAVTRTIVVTAKETQAMLMPPVDVGLARGVRQYAKPPQLEDGVAAGRGDIMSRRTETLVYTAEAAGSFSLPPVRYPWFDLDTSSEAVAELPATEIAVVPAPARNGIAPELETPQKNPFEERRKTALDILVALAAIWLAWMMRRIPAASARKLQDLRAEMKKSRRYRLRRLRRTIQSAELPQVYAALQCWSASEGFRTLGAWTAGNPELAREITHLEAALFGTGNGDFDRGRTAELVGRGAEGTTAGRRSTLPELNPSG